MPSDARTRNSFSAARRRIYLVSRVLARRVRWSVERFAMSWLLTIVARLLAGSSVRFLNGVPDTRQRVYFANHASHIDFMILWSSLPRRVRLKTRPVAGRDYWERSALRRYFARYIFRAVLVDRVRSRADGDNGMSRRGGTLEPMLAALAAGDSLVLFPEGTRTPGPEIGDFKSGLYHLCRANPNLELVPVRLQGTHRILPKGRFVPIPRATSVTFGEPMYLQEGESKANFLRRAREAVLALPTSGEAPAARAASGRRPTDDRRPEEVG